MAMLTSIREHGQGLVEYALLLVLVSLIVISVLLILGPIIGNVFSNLNSKLPTHCKPISRQNSGRLVYSVLRKEVNPNCCNYLYFDRSKFNYLCKKQ
jgi:pilus assembly protein Flp/PilA